MNRIPGIFVCVLACVFAAPAPADQIGYTYDALGRLKTVGYEDGTIVRYDYDSAGNRTSRVVESGRFSINNVTAQEGNSLTFTVTRSGPTSATQSVSYATANGTATAGSDYTARSGSLSFAPGQSSKTVTIAGIEDSTFEPNETFYVNLSSATQGATIADSQGLGTIVNDDAGPAFAINNVTAQEGNALTFTITKSGSTSLTHNVNYATANGTAAAGSDYRAKSGSLSFAPGQSSKTVTIGGLEDSTLEPNETFYVNLSSATQGATIADSQGLGTIVNDDAGPAFSINNVTAQEGKNLTFTITKLGSTSFTHNVNYATANGTAAAGSDYTAKSGSLSFAPGQSSKTLTITSIEDSTFEPNETFFVNLSSATQGATIADSQGYGVVVNDDAGPTFAINNVTAEEGNNLTFTITKSGSTSLTHNVNYATANGKAEAGWDYVAKSGTLSFSPSQTSRTVTISSIEDNTTESDEEFYVNLSAATAGATIADSQGHGTIINDDLPSPPAPSIVPH